MDRSLSTALSRAGSLADVLAVRAEFQPERIAYRFLADGERETLALSYAGLHADVGRVAAALRAVAAPGSRVLLLYPQGPEFVVAFFACLRAGLVAVPAYLPGGRKSMTDRITAILRDADATVAATTAALLPSLSTRGLGGDRPPLWLATDQVPDHTLPQGDTPSAGDALALLQYTSGSTGTPKGVMVTHANLLANTTYVRTAFAVSPESVSVTWLPSFHDMGLVDGILQPVAGGCLGVVMPPLAFLARPARWLEAIDRYRGTHSGGPNFAYDLLVRKTTDGELAPLDLSCWRSAYNGAEPVRADVIARFAERFAPHGLSPRAMYPCYGMAEATLMISGGYIEEPPVVTHIDGGALDAGSLRVAADGAPGTRALVGCGRTWLDTHVVIADPESCAALPDGRVGEIWVQGSSVAKGYWAQPEATAATFDARLSDGRGPFLRTGDLGVMWHGELYVTGRLKDVVILRGQNHYPQDLEAAATRAHAALRPDGVAAFAVDGADGERLVLVAEVERQARATLDAEAIGAAVRAAVFDDAEARVDHLVLIQSGSLPKTSSGKVQRRQCRAQYLEGALRVLGESRAPEGHADLMARPIDLSSPETARDGIRDAAARVLGVPVAAIGSRQPLAAFGLDSLRAVELAAELGRRAQRELPVTIVYDCPTVAALADWLCGRRVSPGRAQPAVRRATPVAIVSVACRFPGARTPEAFWALLRDGRSGVTTVPPDRWDADALDRAGVRARWAGLIDGLDQFDAGFFGLSGREADALDPQHRLLLETAWECLERAGWSAAHTAGASAGVFVGISSQDYFHCQPDDPASADLYLGTGNALSVAANRLSYLFDWTGPSLAVDTACSSSLSAVHLACQALANGDCEFALAGGVNVLLDPSLSAAFSRGQMLASDGRLKAFDAGADGYVRGEGCGVVLLKRLDDARRDGDTVLAVIRGSAMNQDGRSQGLTAPNGRAQEAVITRALAAAGVEPRDVSYVEAHGTGTVLGDPIEASALVRALGPERTSADVCLIGSVKTNVGHLEAAAGIAGLIKTTLLLGAGTIPAHLHLTTLNPRLPLTGTPFGIATTTTAWPVGRPRLAGVSAFGFGGTNVHVILDGRPDVCTEPVAAAADEGSPAILVLSARTPEALQALAERYADILATTTLAWPAICATTVHGRVWWTERLAVVAASAAEAATRLRSHDVYRGRVDASYEPSQPLVSGTPEQIAEAWVRGDVADPGVLMTDHHPRVLLPTYPFQRRRHWRLAAAATPVEPSAAWLRVQSWHERPLGDEARALPASGRWHIVGGPGPLRAAILDRLRARGATAVALAPDLPASSWPVTSGLTGVIVIASPEPFDRVSAEADDEAAAFERALERMYGPALAATQAVMADRSAVPARLWIVTRGAVPAAGVSTDGWSAALLHGFGRAVAQEAGDVAGGLIDLDPAPAPVDDEVESIIAEVLAHPPGPPIQVAYRGGKRLMPRLAAAVASAAARVVRADASYLITGGNGAVGGALAITLAEAGARHLWLMSRTGEVPGALRDRLEALGATVIGLAGDVGDRRVVHASVARVDREGPALAGVVHAAGIVADGTLPRQTMESWRAVARPKVLGAWFLHEATRGRRLDWFVLVSSAAGLLGSPGQANYAAANAWLGGLAAWRRTQGLPAQAIAWGPWKATGVAAVDGAGRRFAALGVDVLEPAAAARAFVSAGQVDHPEVGVWPSVDAPVERHEGVARAAALRVPAAKRRRIIDEQVRRIVAAVLQLDAGVPIDRHRGFLDLGMDSLMAVDLKRRLDEAFVLSLSSTLAFDHPTIDAVVTHIETRLAEADTSAVTVPAPTTDARKSDADLARELDDLERWLE